MLGIVFLLTFAVVHRDFVTGEGVEVTYAGCKWDSYAETHKEGGKGARGINTEEDCAQKCRDTEGCSAFDYDGNKNAWRGIHCWLHQEGKHNSVEMEPADGVVYHQFMNCDAPKPPEPVMQRTVILIKAETTPNEYIFFRGGIDFNVREECFNEEVGSRESACSIPIEHRPQENEEYASYTAWSKNDLVLDWGSSEPDQGAYKNFLAQGSPGIWTSSNEDNGLFSTLNQYGDHYWMLDVNMDCSKTIDGWFDFKTFKFNMEGNYGQWENDILGVQNCDGEAGAASYSSNNHHAKCGALNIFRMGSAQCKIGNLNNLESNTT